MAFEYLGLAVLLLVAFVPSLVYMVRIRNLERYNRNPWVLVLYAFGWGAIAAVIIAVILEIFLPQHLDAFRPARVPEDLFLATVIAPIAEEFAKIVGLLPLVFSKRWEEEDGLVLGAASGLGFAATENLLYEYNAFVTGGAIAFVMVAILRILTSTLLHASATAMAGWGLSKWKQAGIVKGIPKFLAFLLLAMIMHGFFNLFASLGEISGGNIAFTLLSLALVFIFAGRTYRFVRTTIQNLDRRGAPRQVYQM
jgi:RsiW-degrading membrane proteinase PrsW (M82 family)